MQLEVENIVTGKVTGITNFGAFVALPEGKTGMIHISEISNSYVKSIHDFLKEQDEIVVKVLSIEDNGKIALSIKDLHEQNGISPDRPPAAAAPAKKEFKPKTAPRPAKPPVKRSPGSPETYWSPKASTVSNSGDSTFEDMLTKFKQVSNDRMSDLKSSFEGSRSGRGGSGGK